MNREAVRNEIQSLIAEQQKSQVTRKQYPVAKSQLTKLEDLGIRDLMPARFGYTDAAVVIAEAEDVGGRIFVSDIDDVYTSKASTFYTLLADNVNDASPIVQTLRRIFQS